MMKRIKNIVLFFCFCFLSGVSISAQGVNIIEHGDIRTVMNNYVTKNQKTPEVEGWRIQIVSTNDRRKMESVKAKFERLFPNEYLNWEHRSPWYLVKVGAFRTKLELEPVIQELKDDFPQAIPIKDKLLKTELLR